MTPDCTSAVSRGTIEDRISGLPRNIIDYILEFLPIRNAARTSVLSKQWRQKWAMLPCLVLDKLICDKLAVKSLSVFKETVDEILLQHIGDIVKFVLDVSGIHLSSYADIDRWMRNVTRNGVEMLILKMSKSIYAYKLPSYLFNCPTLSNLVLSNCVFKPPNSFVCFQTLTTLAMLGVTFVPTIKSCVVDVPLLVNLTLIDCDGTQYLKIISPQLDTLAVEGSHGFFLNCFMNCTKLRVVILVVDNPIPDERSSLEKLLSSSAPTLKILHLCSALLELLSADRIPKGPPFILNCLWHLSLDVDFGKLIETSCALQIITSAPQLSKLTVSVYATNDNAEAVSKYMGILACLVQPLKKLEYVAINNFECSRIELLFVKLLFARSPSLVRMSIEQKKVIGSKKERNILIELARFPRASPKAELFYIPHPD